jgi:hypothetical protein
LTNTREIGILGISRVAREGKRTRTLGPAASLPRQGWVGGFLENHVSSCLSADIMAALTPPPLAFVMTAHLPRIILEPSNDDFFGPLPKSFNASLNWP